MSRSNHNGCGKTCGLCRPHKKWKSNSPKNQTPTIQRKNQELDEIDEMIIVEEENECK